MASISCRHIYKIYPGNVTAVKDFNLEIADKEFIVFVGPSGCGKSTTLRMIAGLEEISKGEMYIGDRLINDVPPKDRDIAMVFQNYALYPHMTIEENVGYGLRIHKEKKDVIRQRVKEAIDILNLTGLEGRYPKELSGGQRQRVALARAIVKRSDFFLLDEPLSNLDAQLRGQARKELVRIHEMYGQTFIYVTHDQIEAMTVGQRIALLNGGDLQMLDTPHNVYHRPANIFVAKFIGSPSMNILTVKMDGRDLVLGDQRVELPEMWQKKIHEKEGRSLKMGIRPENVVFSREKGPYSVRVNIHYVENYGNRVGFYTEIDGEELISIMPEDEFAKGEDVYWNILPEKLHFFDGETTMSIGYPAELS